MITHTSLPNGKSVKISFDEVTAINEKEALKRKYNRMARDNAEKNQTIKRIKWLILLGIFAISCIFYPIMYSENILGFQNLDVLAFAIAISIFICVLTVYVCNNNQEDESAESLQYWDVTKYNIRYLDNVYPNKIVGIHRKVVDDSEWSDESGESATVRIQVEKIMKKENAKVKTYVDEVEFYVDVVRSKEVSEEFFDVDECTYYLPA